jgi:[calcium/calmodulin-dependent protein kinase] kinase
VNQYKIGRSLGQGAYAKVELGVDVTTGKEYVSHLQDRADG